MMCERFGSFVKRVREERGLTVEEAARRLSVSAAVIAQWESGRSMPDEDGLCRLADMLEVSVPELEAGQYLYDRNDDAVPAEEPLNLPPFSALTKLRRIAAAAMDFFGTMILVGIVMAVVWGSSGSETATELTGSVLILVGLFLRDAVWGGRSLGKRIMGLTVLNKRTGEPPTGWHLVVRDLFFCTLWIDLIVVLSSGRSIGDYVAHTVVLPEKAAAAWKERLTAPSEETVQADARRTKIWLKRIGIGLLVFVLIAAVGALIGLQVAKTTPEYAVAYAYVIESDTFTQLDADQSDVWMNGYSLRSVNGQRSARMTFTVGWRSYSVICHEMNGKWTVCRECTVFS